MLKVHRKANFALMHLYIKNMVCNRCILVVQQELQKLGIHSRMVTLGEVETDGQLTKQQIQQLSDNLSGMGFELLSNSKQQIIEKIKNIIINQIHYADEGNLYKYSEI